MKLRNVELKDLDGQPLKLSPSGPEVVTLARALQTAALAMPEDQHSRRDAKDVIARYELAMLLQKVDVGQEFEIEMDLYTRLKPDLMRTWTTFVAAQVMLIVEPK